jgi:hypothetical protein
MVDVDTMVIEIAARGAASRLSVVRKFSGAAQTSGRSLNVVTRVRVGYVEVSSLILG